VVCASAPAGRAAATRRCGSSQGEQRARPGGDDVVHDRGHHVDMSLPPDQPPPPPAKPTRQAREADRLASIRLRIAIGRELDERGITTPAEIGEALGMPAAEATSLLTRRQWREGDVARLQAAADRLGMQVPQPASSDWPS
jgi:hypothetical protein